MPAHECATRPAADASQAEGLMVCVVGTAEALRRYDADLVALSGEEIVRLDWRLDDDFGEPPAAADWAHGLVVLNSDVWAAPTGCARLQALLKMAWRCGRTVALCGEAVNALSALGFPADVPAEAEGLFLCPQGPCRETMTEFLDALHDQPHKGR